MERSSVVAQLLALGLGHDAIAIPIHDEGGVLVLVSVAHGLSY